MIVSTATFATLGRVRFDDRRISPISVHAATAGGSGRPSPCGMFSQDESTRKSMEPFK